MSAMLLPHVIVRAYLHPSVFGYVRVRACMCLCIHVSVTMFASALHMFALTICRMLLLQGECMQINSAALQ